MERWRSRFLAPARWPRDQYEAGTSSSRRFYALGISSTRIMFVVVDRCRMAFSSNTPDHPTSYAPPQQNRSVRPRLASVASFLQALPLARREPGSSTFSCQRRGYSSAVLRVGPFVMDLRDLDNQKRSQLLISYRVDS